MTMVNQDKMCIVNTKQLQNKMTLTAPGPWVPKVEPL